jgi:Skp family chaperone for outer membrane proteins
MLLKASYRDLFFKNNDKHQHLMTKKLGKNVTLLLLQLLNLTNMKKIVACSLALVLVVAVSAQEPKTEVITKPTIVPVANKAVLLKHKTEIARLYNEYEKLTKKTEDAMARLKKQLEAAMKDLESQDRMDNFEIQRLMSTYNQAETQSSDVRKKMEETKNAVISKL